MRAGTERARQSGGGRVHMIFRFAVVALATVLVVGCGTSGNKSANDEPTTGNTGIAAESTTASPKATVDANVGVCERVHSYMTDKVQPTFDAWKPDVNEFDTTIAVELRDEGTQMYSLASSATGAAQASISAEAKGLTDLSIAVEENDDSAVSVAANAANSALAALRGSCNF